jgi:predicted DNA-binding helix-hairpin-helix protein
MDALAQLTLLGEHMGLERAAEPAASVRPRAACDPSFISHVTLAGGRQVPLMKTLLTSACERNCFYCPFRAGRDFRRATFSPDDLAEIFITLQRRDLVQGIFLSSGVAGGGVRTQDGIIATAEILRQRYGYRGYLHLKVMPGAERDQIVRTMQLADRVSVNLEAPNSARLAQLAPRKTFLAELLAPLQTISEIRQTLDPRLGWNGRWPSSTTQFVVGAVGESDRELLTTSGDLYAKLGLKRAYFMAFNPITGTPFEDRPPASRQRELRLYQASFLLRDYGFRVDELILPDDHLPEAIDPKTAWAQVHLADAPVEINRASPQELLRVPGFGPGAVAAILRARRLAPLREAGHLRALNIRPEHALPFILMAGRRPVQQLALF